MPPIGKKSRPAQLPAEAKAATGAVCPTCGLAVCYHCWECGRDLSAGDHRPGCPDDTGFCAACGGTRKDSKGNPCRPCELNGRIKPNEPGRPAKGGRA